MQFEIKCQSFDEKERELYRGIVQSLWKEDEAVQKLCALFNEGFADGYNQAIEDHLNGELENEGK